MTEEHIVADWTMRAFARSRKPSPALSGTFIEPRQLRVTAEEPFDTAAVVCGPCNNGWMAELDNDAAWALRPLIQGRDAVELAANEQAAVAAWLFKSALTFDAAHSGDDGPLAPLRAAFYASREAPPGCMIHAGPAPPTPFIVDGVPEIAGLAMFGVRQIAGRMNLTVNVQEPDGTLRPGKPKAIPIPGYLVMVGRLQATISGRVIPIVPEREEGMVRIWPTSEEPVRIELPPKPTDTKARR